MPKKICPHNKLLKIAKNRINREFSNKRSFKNILYLQHRLGQSFFVRNIIAGSFLIFFII